MFPVSKPAATAANGSPPLNGQPVATVPSQAPSAQGPSPSTFAYARAPPPTFQPPPQFTLNHSTNASPSPPPASIVPSGQTPPNQSPISTFRPGGFPQMQPPPQFTRPPSFSAPPMPSATAFQQPQFPGQQPTPLQRPASLQTSPPYQPLSPSKSSIPPPSPLNSSGARISPSLQLQQQQPSQVSPPRALQPPPPMMPLQSPTGVPQPMQSPTGGARPLTSPPPPAILSTPMQSPTSGIRPLQSPTAAIQPLQSPTGMPQPLQSPTAAATGIPQPLQSPTGAAPLQLQRPPQLQMPGQPGSGAPSNFMPPQPLQMPQRPVQPQPFGSPLSSPQATPQASPQQPLRYQPQQQQQQHPSLQPQLSPHASPPPARPAQPLQYQQFAQMSPSPSPLSSPQGANQGPFAAQRPPMMMPQQPHAIQQLQQLQPQPRPPMQPQQPLQQQPQLQQSPQPPMRQPPQQQQLPQSSPKAASGPMPQQPGVASGVYSPYANMPPSHGQFAVHHAPVHASVTSSSNQRAAMPATNTSPSSAASSSSVQQAASMQPRVPMPQPMMPNNSSVPASSSSPSLPSTTIQQSHLSLSAASDYTMDLSTPSISPTPPTPSKKRSKGSKNSSKNPTPVSSPKTKAAASLESEDSQSIYEEVEQDASAASAAARGASTKWRLDSPSTAGIHDEDSVPQPPISDPTDLLGRLCSAERIKADDINFWKHCMEGMEWAFYDTQSAEVQKLVQTYCRNFVVNAARSKNLHSLLLVISRHLEHYSQNLHALVSNEDSGATAAALEAAREAAAGGAEGGKEGQTYGANALPTALAKDHAWVTQLIYFLRLVLQHILNTLSYDETLLFFQHLAIPDVASKPNTPKTPANPNMFSQDGNWQQHPPVAVGQMASLSAFGPGQSDALSTAATPVKSVMINLNPNSRRTSLSNSSADILTRFVCAIVNMLEVLGDTGLNQKIMSGKNVTAISYRNSGSTSSTVSGSAGPPGKSSQPLIDIHLELLNTFFVMLSTQMYLPLSTEYEQVFLDRLMYCCKPPLLNSTQGFITSLIWNFTEILPSDWEKTLMKNQSQHSNGVGGQEKKQSFFSKLTSSITNLLYFPVWAVRYLFTIPPNHPIIDRSTLLIELLVYQNNENEFRTAIRNLRNADKPRPPPAALVVDASGSTPTKPVPWVVPEEDLSENSLLENMSVGGISFDKLYYALCSTLLSEHINLFLYSLIHENISFRNYLLHYHSHDLDYLLMPMIEILYKEVDISKHHVYMIINIWILLTQQQGFDEIIKSIRIKDVSFFKEMSLKDLSLTQLMQIVLLRTLQLNLKTKLKEPHIFNNCLAAFCNMTITALMGPPTLTPASSQGTTPSASPPTTPTVSTPGSTVSGTSLSSNPLSLHPQVSFRLTRVLCILSRRFLNLQARHESQILEHNARVELMVSENREELTEEEEREEIDLEEVAEELGTCMEFIQLLLEVVNHSIVHAMPTPHPLQSPAVFAASIANTNAATAQTNTSLHSNPHLLYNLIHSKDFFLQLLPYAHLFEANLISNITNTIAWYERAPGVVIPRGETGRLATAGGGGTGSGSLKRSKVTEKEVERCVQALRKAIANTPLSAAHLGSPQFAAASAAAAHAASSSSNKNSTNQPYPTFDPSALIERGPFTYHEQENSQDFFIPYIYQLAQSMTILPKMINPNESPVDAHADQVQAALAQAGIAPSASSNLGDLNADEVYMHELEQDEEEDDDPNAAAGLNGLNYAGISPNNYAQHTGNVLDELGEFALGGPEEPLDVSAQLARTKLKIAIK